MDTVMREQQLGITLSIIGHNSLDSRISVLNTLYTWVSEKKHATIFSRITFGIVSSQSLQVLIVFVLWPGLPVTRWSRST